MNDLEYWKCLLGWKAESLAVALALPQFQWSKIAVIDNPNKKAVSLSTPLSRKFLTYLDKTYWNNFLKLFAPKEIDSINSFLCPLTIYVRLGNQVVSLGKNSWYDNIDMFFKKNIFQLSNETWNSFNKLDKNKVNEELVNFFSNYAEVSFHGSLKFDVFFKLWENKQNALVLFMKLFVKDWLRFFETHEGVKLWRLIPSLYKISIPAEPNDVSVAEFVFNIIQPHYFFDEDLFNKTASDFLLRNKTFFTLAQSDSLIEEDKKILHVINDEKKTLRSEKFWSFPDLNYNPSENSLMYWSWKYKNPIKQEKKIIIDVNDFVIDQHYFCATMALIDSHYEIRFLQKNQVLFDHQLVDKLNNFFMKKFQEDDFWIHWHFVKESLSSQGFDEPQIDCAISYNNELNPDQHIAWTQHFYSQGSLSNLKSLALIDPHRSYWQFFLHQVTRELWSDLYGASF